jgi:hypothetical protein
VKAHVPDEETREQIRRTLFESLPEDGEESLP